MAMWPTHKPACGQYYDREQLLPSQFNLMQAAGPIASRSIINNVFSKLEPSEESPGLSQLRQMTESLLTGKSPYQDVVDFAGACRTGLLNLKNQSIPLGDLHLQCR